LHGNANNALDRQNTWKTMSINLRIKVRLRVNVRVYPTVTIRSRSMGANYRANETARSCLPQRRQLQRLSVRRTWGDIRKISACTELAWQESSANVEDSLTLIRCLRSPCTLASCEAAGHIQDGTDSSQGAGHSNADVPQRPGTHSCAGTGTAVIRRSANGRLSNKHRSGTTRLRCRDSMHVWNALPAELRLCHSTATFKRHLCLNRFFYELLGFYFIFFVSGPCARLSWPSRQLLSER